MIMVCGLGFRVWTFVGRVQGLGFRVEGLGFQFSWSIQLWTAVERIWHTRDSQGLILALDFR